MKDDAGIQQIWRQQKAVIERGFLMGRAESDIYNDARKIGPISELEVLAEIERLVALRDMKLHFKSEGTRVIRDFVDSARKGADVDDIAALLELALYRDMLRRYVETDEAVSRMSMENLLKLDIYYRRVRAVRQRQQMYGNHKKLAAHVCRATLRKMEESVGGETAEQFRAARETVLEWAAEEFGKETIEELERGESEIEQLREVIGIIQSADNEQNEAGLSEFANVAD